MSIPLREGFVDESLERCLEDLLVRFVINCPEEDLSSEERVLFQIEEAHWFYQDFLRTLNPLLPSMKMKQFTNKIIEQCPLIWKWGDPSEALAQFGVYKSTIPVRGCALLNSSMDKMLLVKGIESPSWGFPRGKISKGETDVECALRELEEETGFDASDLIDEDEFVERTIRGKNYKMFIIKGVPDDTKFVPQVRYEIVDIKWMDIKFLTKAVKTTSHYYLVGSMLKSILSFIKRMKNNESEEELKRLATIQLKKILGINESAAEEEREDPGRALLSMLQVVAKNAQHISVNSDDISFSSQQNSHVSPSQQQQPQQPQQPQKQEHQQQQSQNPLFSMPIPPNILQMQQNRLVQLPFQNQFPLQMFNPMLFSNYSHSMPHPFLAPPISNPMASQGMAVVPSASSFSKPQFSLASKRSDHANSKELLNILKSKPQPKDNARKSSSAELLSILKKPAVSSPGPIKILKRETPLNKPETPEINKNKVMETPIAKTVLDITEPANNTTTRDMSRPFPSGKPIMLLKKNNPVLSQSSDVLKKQLDQEPKISSPEISTPEPTEKSHTSSERKDISVGSLSLLTNPNEKNKSDPSTQLLAILQKKQPVETPSNNVGVYASNTSSDKSKELLTILTTKSPITTAPSQSPSPQTPIVNMNATNELLNILHKKTQVESTAPQSALTEQTSNTSSALLELLKRPSSSTASITTRNSSPMPQNYASPLSQHVSMNGFNTFQQPQFQVPMQQPVQQPMQQPMHQLQPMQNPLTMDQLFQMQQQQVYSPMHPQVQPQVQQPQVQQPQVHQPQVHQPQVHQPQVQQQPNQTNNVSSLLNILKGPKKSNIDNYGITENPIFNSFNNNISQQTNSPIISDDTKEIQDFQEFEDFDDGEIEGEYINNGGLYDDDDDDE